jgi:multidrug resistance efflux pump
LLIKGFQKENEKFVAENKNLRKEIEGLQERLFNENKKVNEFRTKLVHNTNNVLLTDYEVDIETRKALGGENVISRKELNEANEKIAKLQNELASRESLHQNRELELKYELDRLRA